MLGEFINIGHNCMIEQVHVLFTCAVSGNSCKNYWFMIIEYPSWLSFHLECIKLTNYI